LDELVILTFQDAVERLVDYLGCQPSDNVLRDAKQACIEALRDITQSFVWTYLYTHGRIQTVPSYDTGTITYLESTGSNPFEVTLTGGTWPDWASFGTLKVGINNYDVDRRISGTVLTLKSPLQISGDITEATPYGLFRDSYSLPSDFAAEDCVVTPENWFGLYYVHPREWLYQTARWSTTGTPRHFTIMQDQDYGGRLAFRLAPLPQEALTIDFIYKRRPAALVVFKVNGGTVTTAADSNVVQGAGTAFTANMAGDTVIRISGNTKPPTAEFGDNAAVFESKVVSVDTTLQALTLLDAVPSTLTAAPYTVSSWVDITTGTMSQAYLRCCEHHIAMSRTLKDKPSAHRQYKEALEIAKSADSRSNAPRHERVGHWYRPRLRDLGPLNLNRES
jgi:hypothetical protein